MAQERESADGRPIFSTYFRAHFGKSIVTWVSGRKKSNEKCWQKWNDCEREICIAVDVDQQCDRFGNLIITFFGSEIGKFSAIQRIVSELNP